MAIETLTIPLGASGFDGSKIKGKQIVSGDEDDRQIVTVEDGGDISGTIMFEFWGKDTSTEAGDGDGGNDEFHFDLSGFDDDFHIEVKSFDALDRFFFTGFDSMEILGGVYHFHYTGTDGQPHTVTIDPVSQNGTGTVSVMCFTQGALIRTPQGDVPIEKLTEGDYVLCGDGEERRIQWIGQRRVNGVDLKAHPELKPVVLSKDALGRGAPESELRLSPQHRVMLNDWRAELMFGAQNVLASAKSLVNDSTVRVASRDDEVVYYHILLEGHHTVYANGLECETLMPAEMAQSAMGCEAREEILTLFPELVTDMSEFGETCGVVLKPHEVQALMAS